MGLLCDKNNFVAEIGPSYITMKLRNRYITIGIKKMNHRIPFNCFYQRLYPGLYGLQRS